MKKSIVLLLLTLIALSTLLADNKPCGRYNGKNIYKGEAGGCYYLKGKEHRKIYIDKKNCKCK